MTCRILVPWPGIKPELPAAEAQSLNHWTAREFPSLFLCMGRCKSLAHWNHSLDKHLSYLGPVPCAFLKLHLWGRVSSADCEMVGVFVSFLSSLRAHHRGWLQLLIAGHPLFTATAGIIFSPHSHRWGIWGQATSPWPAWSHHRALRSWPQGGQALQGRKETRKC